MVGSELSGEGGFSRSTDLTGVWSGEYWYLFGGRRTSFAAHIIETAGSLEGTTLEPATFGAGPGDLSASISGFREGANVAFVKRYDPAPGVHGEPIFYTGTADAALATVEGRWAFGQFSFWRGGFRMTRASHGAKAAVKRKAREPVKVGR